MAVDTDKTENAPDNGVAGTGKPKKRKTPPKRRGTKQSPKRPGNTSSKRPKRSRSRSELGSIAAKEDDITVQSRGLPQRARKPVTRFTNTFKRKLTKGEIKSRDRAVAKQRARLGLAPLPKRVAKKAPLAARKKVEAAKSENGVVARSDLTGRSTKIPKKDVSQIKARKSGASSPRSHSKGGNERDLKKGSASGAKASKTSLKGNTEQADGQSPQAPERCQSRESLTDPHMSASSTGLRRGARYVMTPSAQHPLVRQAIKPLTAARIPFTLRGDEDQGHPTAATRLASRIAPLLQGQGHDYVLTPAAAGVSASSQSKDRLPTQTGDTVCAPKPPSASHSKSNQSALFAHLRKNGTVPATAATFAAATGPALTQANVARTSVEGMGSTGVPSLALMAPPTNVHLNPATVATSISAAATRAPPTNVHGVRANLEGNSFATAVQNALEGGGVARATAVDSVAFLAVLFPVTFRSDPVPSAAPFASVTMPSNVVCVPKALRAEGTGQAAPGADGTRQAAPGAESTGQCEPNVQAQRADPEQAPQLTGEETCAGKRLRQSDGTP